MSSLSRFGARMQELGQRVADNADALTRKTALAVDSAVVLATPVDTGRARANWQVSIGAPATGTTEETNYAASLNHDASVIASYKGGSAIHITNNLPYIGRLNNGHSAQAPIGFVQEAVLAGVETIRGLRVLVKSGDRVIGGSTGRIG